MAKRELAAVFGQAEPVSQDQLAKARIAQRAYAGSDSGGGESEVLPYRYLARDGSGHNTPQTAVLVEGRATRDYLELDDYDVLGNRTGYATGISAAPTTMSYGDQMRNAFWGAGQMAYGGVKGAVNGVPAFVVGTVKGYAYIGAGLRDGFDSLVGNRSSNYLDRAIQAGTPHTGEIWSYDNGLQRLGGYGGELLSPAAYSAGLRVGGRLGTAFIDGIGTGPMSGSRSAQRGAINLSSPRYQPGVVAFGDDLVPASGNWLSAATPAPIPLQVARALEGQSFKTFPDLQSAVWRTIGNDAELSAGFSEQALGQMSIGNAPFAPRAFQNAQFGGRFNLHHVDPIASGGGVYDLSNIRIVSPRVHTEIHYP